jgi:hypothetical protein
MRTHGFFAALLMVAGSAAGQTCYSGSLGYPGFSGREDLRLSGSAEIVGDELVLTPAAPGQAGSAWFGPFAPTVTDPWFAEFTIRLDGEADGMAFVIQSSDPFALGCDGSCLGYAGIPNSLAVEFDTFAFSGEFPTDHVSVQSNFAGPNSNSDASSLASAVLSQDLNDGQPHRVRLAYDGADLRVWVDGALEITVAVDFAAGIADAGGCAYVGFTGGTGGVFAAQAVTEWAHGQLGFSIDSFQTVDDAVTVGDASFENGALRVTAASPGQAGAAWHPQQQTITEPWVTTFEFRLDGTADGLAFVIHDSGLGALGAGGSGMGYASNGPAGIARSLAVEFDTFSFPGEFDADHVSIQTRYADPNSSDDADSLAHGVLTQDLNDGEVHRAMIAYDGQTLRVSVDGAADVDLADMSSAGAAWVGFTGGTGAATADQDVLAWRFGPSQGCLNTDIMRFIFDQQATPGDTLVLHWVASGSYPRAYEWRLNANVVSDGGAISGAQTDTLVISPVGPEHAGQWDYSVSNACSGVGSGFTLGVAPACDPDMNQDGNVDQDDVSYLINVVGGGDNPTGIDPDFNQDGNVDQDDIGALINVVAGGDCP